MDRRTLLEMWNEWWEGDTWFTAWTKALDGLTPAQAAWQPEGGGAKRHSIWQIVVHVAFWREVTLAKLAGKPTPSDEQTAAEQFAQPSKPTDADWRKARERLAASQRNMSAAIADEKNSLERPRYHLAHDAYHLGQIMYVRAMLGLGPVV